MSDTDQAPETGETSTALSRRHLLMGGGMIVVAGAAYARTPRQRYPNITDAKFDAMFPKAFGDWQILPASELIMPPGGGLEAKLYQHILTRTYANSAHDTVMLLIAYNSEQVNNVQVHRPEICYAASGFDIKDSQPYDLAVTKGEVIPARIVRAERVTRTENIIYWTRIGDRFPQSWTMQRVAMTEANLQGFYADGLLVRASIVDNDEKKSIAMISEFLRQFALHSPAEARHLAFRA
jgi:EpsI family protein